MTYDPLSSGPQVDSDSSIPVPPIQLRVSPEAAKQLYPGRTGHIDCKTHGTQLLKKVQTHLFDILDSSARIGCGQCVQEAIETHDTQRRERRQQSQEAKIAKKAATQETLELAKDTDVSLAERAQECQNADDSLATAKVEVEAARGFVVKYRKRLSEIDERMVELVAYRERTFQQLLADDGALDEAMTSLDSAHTVVDTCYTALREETAKVDSLWSELSKSARKKRDKTNRKAAVALLNEREGADAK